MQGTWLLVFTGTADWPTVIASVIDGTAHESDEAHSILSREHDGDRWSLLLAHWTIEERDRLVTALSQMWDQGFVNRLDDLGDLDPDDGLLVRPTPRPDWDPLPEHAADRVSGRVFYASHSLVIAMLRFAPGASITEHDAPNPADVFCVEGAGYVKIDGVASPFTCGEWAHWPANVMHQLWTEDGEMTTLMFERH